MHGIKVMDHAARPSCSQETLIHAFSHCCSKLARITFCLEGIGQAQIAVFGLQALVAQSNLPRNVTGYLQAELPSLIDGLNWSRALLAPLLEQANVIEHMQSQLVQARHQSVSRTKTWAAEEQRSRFKSGGRSGVSNRGRRSVRPQEQLRGDREGTDRRRIAYIMVDKVDVAQSVRCNALSE